MRNRYIGASLDRIVGNKLSSVEFVMDYHQLRFDGPCITAYIHPEVTVADTIYRWGEPGYRDALCERIASVVQKASIVEDKELCVDFDDGSSISISLRSEDYEGPEAVEFYLDDRHLWVL